MSSKFGVKLIGGLASLAMVAGVVGAGPAPAGAAEQIGDGQVVINGGGGSDLGGADGIQILLNNLFDEEEEEDGGSDEILYRNTSQFCCGGAGPMLAIGDLVFAAAYLETYITYDPAEVGNETAFLFDSMTVSGLTGSAINSSQAGTLTGSGSAVLLYSITVDGKLYQLKRSVDYTYPNDSFLDSYEVIVPPGNTEVVKLYVGGDTAPGGSDEGVGFETTSPLRTIYSVNPDSNIQLFYSEVFESEPFDGATSADYDIPKPAIRDGGDIGFNIDEEDHDAGIMIQWTLGSNPGTYSRSMTQSVGDRGVALGAYFTNVQAGSATLNLSLANTSDEAASGIGFTFALPTGMTIDGSATSNCGGTLTAVDGSASVTVSGVSVDDLASCLIQLPVVASAAGTYEISPALVTGVTALQVAVAVETVAFEALESGSACNREIEGDLAAGSGTSGLVSRLYMAVMNRQPDAAGHAYWSDKIDTGETTAEQVVDLFVTSPEFAALYDAADDSDFVELLYNNVMCRDSDAPGKGYWLAQLDGDLDRNDVVLLFSESPEFKMHSGTS